MKIYGYIRLHCAVDLLYRFFRIKGAGPFKVRAALRRAILRGDLTVHGVEPRSFIDDMFVYWAIPETSVPAWAFENDVAAEQALVFSRMPTDPRLRVPRPYHDLICVLDRAELRSWLAKTNIADGDTPGPTEAHDKGDHPPRAEYMEPNEQPFISLSAAISWADGSMSFAGQNYTDAYIHVSDPDTMDQVHGDILQVILEAARDGRLEMIGRPYVGSAPPGDMKILTAADLTNFQRFDASEESLIRGRGIAGSKFQEFSQSDSLREDGLCEVQVSRKNLFRIYKPKRKTSTIGAQGKAEKWLARAFEADRELKRKKSDFKKVACKEIAGLSGRGFDRAWDTMVTANRRKPGRPSTRTD